MSKSCFLSLSNHNPAGMKCGFGNSCGLGQTQPGGEEGDGAGPARRPRLPHWRPLLEGSGTAVLPGHRPRKLPRAQSGHLAPGTGPFHRQRQGPDSEMWPRALLLILVTPTPRLSSSILPVKNPGNKSRFFPKLVRCGLWRRSSGILTDLPAEDAPRHQVLFSPGQVSPSNSLHPDLFSTVCTLFYILVSVKATPHFLSWTSFC